MSNKPRKYCASYPCNQIAVNGAYCLEHRPTPAPKETDPFYLSTRWRRFRDFYISKHPLCEQCEAEGRPDTAADMVDHIVEIEDSGALTSEANAMSMCFHCHNVKTASERNRRKNHQLPKPDNRIGSARDTYL
jgi:5-methylcytosine-specific restriction protein A